MWTAAFLFIKKWAWTKLLSKLPIKALVVLGATVIVLAIGWYAAHAYKTLRQDNTDMLLSLTKVISQNASIKKINLTNQKNYETIKANQEYRHELTLELLESIGEIKNVEHTKEVIIREAVGECLDAPYPDNVYATFLWEQKEASP